MEEPSFSAAARNGNAIYAQSEAEVHPAFRVSQVPIRAKDLNITVNGALQELETQSETRSSSLAATPQNGHVTPRIGTARTSRFSRRTIRKRVPRGDDADDTILTSAPSQPAPTVIPHYTLFPTEEETPRTSMDSLSLSPPKKRIPRTAQQNAQLGRINEVYEISLRYPGPGNDGDSETTVKRYQYNFIGHFNPFHPGNRAVVGAPAAAAAVAAASSTPQKKILTCSMPPVANAPLSPPPTPTSSPRKILSCSVPPPPRFDQPFPLTPPMSVSSSSSSLMSATNTNKSLKESNSNGLSIRPTSPITALPSLFEDYNSAIERSSVDHRSISLTSTKHSRQPSVQGSLTGSISSLRARTTLLFSSPRLAHLFRTSTPLITAAKAGDTEEVLRLLSLDASRSGTNTDRKGLSALHHAALTGHIDILRALITHHAALDTRTKNHDRTPLYYAAEKGHASAVALLVAAGALATERSKYDGATPLHKSSQGGHLTTMELLIAAGADIDARDSEGMRPLFWASQAQQLSATKMLIAHGADLEARIRGGRSLELRTSTGVTVLHKAVTTASHALVRLFLEAGADPNADAPHGMLCLHRAAVKGDLLLVAMLLEGGADVHAVTKDGWTPLHCAARYGHKKVGRMLVWAGADERRLTKSGLDVRQLGRRYGFENVLGGWSCG